MSDAASDAVDETMEDAVVEQAPEVTPEERTFAIEQFPEKLAVVRLPVGADVPGWVESSSLFSITATARETSLVCARRTVPRKVTQAGPFTAFAVQGQLDFSLTGVLVQLLTPLAEAGISVFTISTFDTDWVLVPVGDADRAAEEWRRRGHTVAPAVPVDPSAAQRTNERPTERSQDRPQGRPAERTPSQKHSRKHQEKKK